MHGLFFLSPSWRPPSGAPENRGCAGGIRKSCQRAQQKPGSPVDEVMEQPMASPAEGKAPPHTGPITAGDVDVTRDGKMLGMGEPRSTQRECRRRWSYKFEPRCPMPACTQRRSSTWRLQRILQGRENPEAGWSELPGLPNARSHLKGGVEPLLRCVHDATMAVECSAVQEPRQRHWWRSHHDFPWCIR